MLIISREEIESQAQKVVEAKTAIADVLDKFHSAGAHPALCAWLRAAYNALDAADRDVQCVCDERCHFCAPSFLASSTCDFCKEDALRDEDEQAEWEEVKRQSEEQEYLLLPAWERR